MALKVTTFFQVFHIFVFPLKTEKIVSESPQQQWWWFCFIKLSCDSRFQRAFTACSCVFKVITLVWVNQRNFFKNATTCSKRIRKTLVATQLKASPSSSAPRIRKCFSQLPSSRPFRRCCWYVWPELLLSVYFDLELFWSKINRKFSLFVRHDVAIKRWRGLQTGQDSKETVILGRKYSNKSQTWL